jgi:hypothetical protein
MAKATLNMMTAPPPALRGRDPHEQRDTGWVTDEDRCRSRAEDGRARVPAPLDIIVAGGIVDPIIDGSTPASTSGPVPEDFRPTDGERHGP